MRRAPPKNHTLSWTILPPTPPSKSYELDSLLGFPKPRVIRSVVRLLLCQLPLLPMTAIEPCHSFPPRLAIMFWTAPPEATSAPAPDVWKTIWSKFWLFAYNCTWPSPHMPLN